MHRHRLAAVLFALSVSPLHQACGQSGPEALVGAWLGALEAQGVQLRVALHVTVADDGLHATFDSLDQGATGLPVDEIAFADGRLRFRMRRLGASFDGALAADGTSIDGTFTQGVDLPLVLRKVDKVEPPKRPQLPQPPFPYRSEEVVYAYDRGAGPSTLVKGRRDDDGWITLAGTLTLPAGDGPFPAALLITGSGAQDRDETLLGHKPFLVLADDLSRNGFAVLRVDDRGVGGSTGDPKTSTSADYAEDVRAGVRFLRGRTDIDAARVGLIGHSEGGLIAPLVAAGADGAAVAFLVLLAGPGVDGRDILRVQSAAIARAGGASDELVAESAALDERLYAIVLGEPDAAKRRQRLEAEVDRAWPDASAALQEASGGKEAMQQQVRQIAGPWFRYFLQHDPAAALQQVRCPVLALNGERDLQVVPGQNLPAIEAALRAGPCEDFECRELPGLNHLFQPCETGSPQEYSAIETTLDPSALAAVREWLAARFRR